MKFDLFLETSKRYANESGCGDKSVPIRWLAASVPVFPNNEIIKFFFKKQVTKKKAF